jgi:hypothetical protein
MGRPKLNPATKKVCVGLTIKPAVLEAARNKAYEEGISLSALVELLLNEYSSKQDDNKSRNNTAREP